jgi:hypothetical protein
MEAEGWRRQRWWKGMMGRRAGNKVLRLLERLEGRN